MTITSTLLSACLLLGTAPAGLDDDPALALDPIPLDKESQGRNGSGEFVQSHSWTVINPDVLNGVVFSQPNRNQGLGAKTDEWFDNAYLQLSPAAEGTVGVSQPLLDPLPVLAQPGDRYRVGVNLRR